MDSADDGPHGDRDDDHAEHREQARRSRCTLRRRSAFSGGAIRVARPNPRVVARRATSPQASQLTMLTRHLQIGRACRRPARTLRAHLYPPRRADRSARRGRRDAKDPAGREAGGVPFIPRGRGTRSRAVGRGSDRLGTDLAGADPHDLLDRGDEDLAVADHARCGLSSEIPSTTSWTSWSCTTAMTRIFGSRSMRVLLTAPLLRDALLDPVALDLDHGEPGVAQAHERVLDALELLGPEDGFDLLHHASPPTGFGCGVRRALRDLRSSSRRPGRRCR